MTESTQQPDLSKSAQEVDTFAAIRTALEAPLPAGPWELRVQARPCVFIADAAGMSLAELWLRGGQEKATGALIAACDPTTIAALLAAADRAKELEADARQGDVVLPPLYMLAKLSMVMPLFQEARDALTAINESQRKLHGIRADLADRMDEAGTYSLDDWLAAIDRAQGEQHAG